MSEYDDICNDVASSLESDFIRLEMENKRLEEENKQLREVLKKCSPWRTRKRIPPTDNSVEAYEAYCGLCDSMFDHTDDCEYIRLINGEVE